MTVRVIYDRKTLVRTRRRFQNSGRIYRRGNKDIHTPRLACQDTEEACVPPKRNREGRKELYLTEIHIKHNLFGTTLSRGMVAVSCCSNTPCIVVKMALLKTQFLYDNQQERWENNTHKQIPGKNK